MIRWAGRAIAAWAKHRADLIVENLCLRQQLDESVAYFNAWRPHQGLGQRAPCGSAPTALSYLMGRIIGRPVLEGLHHVYHHAA